MSEPEILDDAQVAQALQQQARWGVKNTGMHRTRDGYAWSAKVYRAGEQVGDVEDEGRGGALFCRDMEGRYVGCGEGDGDRGWLVTLRADMAQCGVLNGMSMVLACMADLAAQREAEARRARKVAKAAAAPKPVKSRTREDAIATLSKYAATDPIAAALLKRLQAEVR